jgi:hypothetical protein
MKGVLGYTEDLVSQDLFDSRTSIIDAKAKWIEFYFLQIISGMIKYGYSSKLIDLSVHTLQD